MKIKFKNDTQLGTRIRKQRELLKKTRNELADTLGVSLSTLQLWETNEREPQASMIITIADQLGVTPNYLLTGEKTSINQQALGFTPSTEQEQPNETEKNVNFQQEDETYDDIVDYRDVRISAGFGYENDEPTELNTIKVERAWFLRNRLNAKNCAMFKVSGDSMYPTLDDNEEIIVDCSKKDLTEGKIFIINHSGTMWVKRIKRNFDSIELISDNNFYDPIKLNEEESNQLNIIGQVVRGYRDF
ncbi:XRE family transcriptional regulator [Lonepinella sp. BR2271]|uniref:XRE family transcriptional regulator n=1 Tax=Lonepinella sp. BR2271 TaxID=3434550 RepID=UPI003F6DAD50